MRSLGDLAAAWEARPRTYSRVVWALALALDALPWPWGEEILARCFVAREFVRTARLRRSSPAARAERLGPAPLPGAPDRARGRNRLHQRRRRRRPGVVHPPARRTGPDRRGLALVAPDHQGHRPARPVAHGRPRPGRDHPSPASRAPVRSSARPRGVPPRARRAPGRARAALPRAVLLPGLLAAAGGTAEAAGVAVTPPAPPSALDGRPLDPAIFVGGMPRSGTSLMRAILAAHPDVAMFPGELPLWSQLARAHAGQDLSRPAARGRLVRDLVTHPRMKRAHVTLDGDALAAALDAEPVVRLGTVFALALRQYARQTGKARWGAKD